MKKSVLLASAAIMISHLVVVERKQKKLLQLLRLQQKPQLLSTSS